MVRKVIDLVVSSLELFSVIGFFLFLLGGFVTGWSSNGFFGAIAGLIVAFVINVIVFGVLFLVIQNNKILKEIRDTLKSKA